MADKNIYLGSGPKDPNLGRSTYDWSFTNHMSAKLGLIYPCFLAEMPASFSLKLRAFADFDLMPLVFPLQSRINMHISFFKCAFRNLWRGHKDFVSRVGNHVMPYVNRSYNWHETGSLADYMNITSYTARPSIGWHALKPFNDGVQTNVPLARPYQLPVDITDRQEKIFNKDTDNEFSATYFKKELWSDFFSTTPTDDTLAAVILTDKLRHEVSVEQPYMQIKIVTMNNSVKNFAPLQVRLYSYQSSHIENHRGRDVSIAAAWHMWVTNENMEYNCNTSIATSLDKIAYGEYRLTDSRPFATFGNSNLYIHTFTFHLRDDLVKLANQLLSLDTHSVYLALEFPDTDVNAIDFGHMHSPNIGVAPVINNVANSITNQAFSFSNGHLAYTSSTYFLKFGGIQSDILYRFQSSALYSPEASPFVSLNGNAPVRPINALPFRMYEFIYNLYFRNSQVDPFIKNGVPTYNEYLTNDGDGADSSTPLDFKHSLYESDYFTTAKFTPQMGNAPLVGISHTPGADSAVFMFEDEDGNPVRLKVATDSSNHLTGIDEYSTNANESTLKNLNALINYGISINDFRSVSAFQRFLERNQRAGFDYKSIVKEFFGTNAPIGEEFPEYLGGYTQPINIYKIENQASTDLPLGYFAGSGYVRAKDNKQNAAIKCFCSEQSYVMGLVWFSVTPVYGQVLPKHWTKSHLLDYYNPQFATIGNQPIYNYEVAPLQAANNDQLNGVFGYQRPWYEYTARMDEVHGEFRSSLHNYVMQREFGDMPQLGKEFIEINQDDLSDPFAYTLGSDKFFGAIRFKCTCKNTVPRFIQPSIVG